MKSIDGTVSIHHINMSHNQTDIFTPIFRCFNSKAPSIPQEVCLIFSGWKVLLLGAVFLTACSPAPETQKLGSESSTDGIAVESDFSVSDVAVSKIDEAVTQTEDLMAEDMENSTYSDQPIPLPPDENLKKAPEVDPAPLAAGEAESIEAPSSVPLQWYSDFPTTKSEQIQLKVTLEKEERKLEREISLFRENLIKGNVDLATMQAKLDAVRQQELDAVEQSMEIKELSRIHAQQKLDYQALGSEIETMALELQANGEFTPEKWVQDQHPKQVGCCGLHYPDDADLDSPGQRYLAKVGEQRKLLMEIAGYGRLKSETIASLRETQPEIRTLHQEIEEISSLLQEEVDKNIDFLKLKKDLRDLRNKKLYVGRVIMEDALYTKNIPSPSERQKD